MNLQLKNRDTGAEITVVSLSLIKPGTAHVIYISDGVLYEGEYKLGFGQTLYANEWIQI